MKETGPNGKRAPEEKDELNLNERQLAHRVRSARPADLPNARVARIEQRALKRLTQNTHAARQRNTVLARWALALLLVAALIATSTGVVAASTTSLPGDALYPVKRLSENVRLSLTPASEQAGLHLDFAGRRLGEVEALAAKGIVASDTIREMADESELALAGIQVMPPDQQVTLLAKLADLSQRQQSVLNRVEGNAPAEAREALERARLVSQRGLEQAQKMIHDHSNQPGPNNIPPGLQRTVTPPTHKPPNPSSSQDESGG